MDAPKPVLLSGAERRSMLRDALAVVSSSHLATVCGVLQNLFVLSIVPPRMTGIWTAIRTILDYGNYSSLGINRAAGIDIAVAAGREDHDSRERIGNAAMTSELCTASLLSVALVLTGAVCWVHGNGPWAAALIAGAVVSLVSRYYAFNLIVLRSIKKFPTLARARVLGAVGELVLFATGAYLFNFYGLLGAAAIAQLANAWYVRFDGGLRFRRSIDWQILRQLLASGWPLAAEALALAALRSVDRLVIVRCLTNGDEQLGWYKIAIVMGAWAFDQSNLVSGVLLPRLGEVLGRTNDSAAVLRMGLRVAELVGLGMILCVAALMAIAIPLVEWLLPAYRPGLVAAAGMVTAAALLGTSMPLRFALLTVGRTKSMLVATGISALVSCGAGFIVTYGSNDVQGAVLGRIAWTSAASAGLLLAVTLCLCTGRCRERVPLAGRVIGIAAYLTVAAATLQSIQSHRSWVALVAGLWVIVPAWLLLRSVDWRAVVARSAARLETRPRTG